MHYDAVQNRYFKIPPAGERLPSTIPPVKKRRVSNTHPSRKSPPSRLSGLIRGVETGNCTAAPTPRHHSALALAFSPRKRVLPTEMRKLSDTIWALCKGDWPVGHPYFIASHADDLDAKFSYDNYAYAFYRDMVLNVSLSDGVQGVPVLQCSNRSLTMTALRIAADGRMAVAWKQSRRSSVQYFDLSRDTSATFNKSSALLGIVLRGWSDYMALALDSVQFNVVFAGDRAGLVSVADLRAPDRVGLLKGEEANSVTDLKAIGHGLWVSRLRNGEHNLGMWDLRQLDGGPVALCRGHVNAHKWLSFDVRDGLVAAGGDDGRVRLWDCERTSWPLASFQAEDVVSRLQIGAFDDDGKWVGRLCYTTACNRTFVCGGL